MHEVSLLIDGVSRGASDDATFDRIDPATGQVASPRGAGAPRPPGCRRGGPGPGRVTARRVVI
ncbi:hypothetical protein K6W12_19290, partial [Burkholderia multivorans]